MCPRFRTMRDHIHVTCDGVTTPDNLVQIVLELQWRRRVDSRSGSAGAYQEVVQGVGVVYASNIGEQLAIVASVYWVESEPGDGKG